MRVKNFWLYLQPVCPGYIISFSGVSCWRISPLPCRAAEKLSLTLRKKGQASDPAPAHFSTCFRDIIQKNPPPVPSCLLQAATRTKDSPNVGKVGVGASNSTRLRVDIDVDGYKVGKSPQLLDFN